MKRFILFLTSQRVTNTILAFISLVTLLVLFKVGQKSDLLAKFDSKIYIGQRMGELKFYHSISVKNIGNKTGFITKIRGYVRAKKTDMLTFNRQLECEYFISANYSKPFLEVPLTSDEAFDTELQLVSKLGRFDQDSISILQSKVLDERDSYTARGVDFRTKTASGQLSKTIENFIIGRIQDLKQGEYEYIIELFNEKSDIKPFAYKCYSFTLYDSNIKLLKETIKSYKTVFQLPIDNIGRPNIQVYLTEITNPDIINSLTKDVQ